VANIANAVKRISVQKGHDVTRYALTTFGGAGGQHACMVADSLGIRTVLVPPMAGVLSALGIGLADTTAMREQSVEAPLEASAMPGILKTADDLEGAARAELLAEDVPEDRIRVTRRAQLRYDGTDTALTVELTEPDAMTRTFEDRHRATYSFTLDRPVVVEALSVEATGLTEPPDLSALVTPNSAPGTPETVSLHTGGTWRDVPLRRREELPPGDTVTGPAIITEASSTTVVDDGWQAAMTDDGHLVMERVAVTESSDLGTEVDPVLLEVFNNLFMAIAEQMGARLESTAQSVNIKERLDFSCALFDPDGNLVANAPHIPVHLGSMGTSVKEVIRRRGDSMRPGDTYAVNDPYHGGTHLPDVTVITPVFDTEGDGTKGGDDSETRRQRRRRGRRAHPLLRRLARSPRRDRRHRAGLHAREQPHHRGGRHPLRQLAARGRRRLRETETRSLLTVGAATPRANPTTNLADLRAQIAANTEGRGRSRPHDRALRTGRRPART
jgi:5-oxoprolinase (ATP-hydrolysing)